MRTNLLLLIAGLFCAAVTPPASCQSFELASVKPAVRLPGQRIARREDPTTFDRRPINLFNLILHAYGLKTYQLSGPDWIKNSYYDVVAKLPAGASANDIPVMLRQLLTDRFHLSIRREVHRVPAYLLQLDSGGPMLTSCKVPDQAVPPTIEEKIGALHSLRPGECPANRAMTRGDSFILIEANTLDFVASALQPAVPRPVFNRTGMEGHYAIAFESMQLVPVEVEDGPAYPSMATALKKLGLKLEAHNEDIEQIVIVSVDKVPTEN